MPAADFFTSAIAVAVFRHQVRPREIWADDFLRLVVQFIEFILGVIKAYFYCPTLICLPSQILQVLFLPLLPKSLALPFWLVLVISSKLHFMIRFLSCAIASIYTTLKSKSRTLQKFLEDEKGQFPQLGFILKISENACDSSQFPCNYILFTGTHVCRRISWFSST